VVTTIDLGGLTFIDSVGLNAIVSIRTASLARGGAVRLMNVSPRINRTFLLGGLASLL
jgi:anti-anti-sigma factor